MLRNYYQSKENRDAAHKPSKTWRFACLGQDGTYTRVDPHEDEELHEFTCYIVKKLDGNKFVPLNKLKLPKVYS